MNDQVFLLPDLGEGLTEADILEWRVAVGDTVRIDQIIAEVETAKAAVEVPVPFEGTVIELHGAAGDTLRVGTPLVTIRGVDADAAGSSSGASREPAGHEQYREEERAGSGNVLIGYGTGFDAPRRRRRVPVTHRSPATPEVHEQPEAVRSTSIPVPPSAPRVISPLVRNLALREGIDLSRLTGTGPGGIIVRADVESHANVENPPAPAAPAPGPTRFHLERIPLKGLRKTVADKLSTSRREIPDATTWVDVDATELLRARTAINHALPPEDQVSLLALLARLTIAALSRYPELNASVDTARGEIIRHGQVNLGVAAQTPRGLVVPVLDHADTMTTVELARALRDTVETAREGKLPPARLTGGTFTLNNYGVFGVDGSTPIINHPEAAILGIGRILDRPWVADGVLTVRKLTQVSLSFDHRVCDGGAAGGFLRLFADYLENPVAALGRL
ncbi:dihydrolipoamide acetyltransferase family protein [Nocardia sp. NPDC101769]|uniref:dihydrolipoamide acetyltransferase family protein n=1 Tax=Nocardia sp. NPDC101769 TaxID=3364333 RepID=UPI0038170CBC